MQKPASVFSLLSVVSSCTNQRVKDFGIRIRKVCKQRPLCYAKKALTFDVKKHRVNMFDFLILVNAEREKMSKRYKGILCILAAAFCFAIMNASVRASGELPLCRKHFSAILSRWCVPMQC